MLFTLLVFRRAMVAATVPQTRKNPDSIPQPYRAKTLRATANETGFFAMTVLDKLPSLINSAFNTLFYDAVMTVDVQGTGGDPFDPPIGSTQSYSCKAYVEQYSAYYRANSLVSIQDRKVIVLAASLSTEPVKGARITVNNVAFTIIDYSDAGSNKAIWEIQGRM